jgi:hypothetical protein
LLPRANPKKNAATILISSPIKVSAFGEILVNAKPLTIFCRSQPLPFPNALVQVKKLFLRGQRPVHRFFLTGTALAVRLIYSAVSWIVVSFNTSSSRLPFGVTTIAVSPTFLPSSARPMGEVVEMSPCATSDSSLVTSL